MSPPRSELRPPGPPSSLGINTTLIDLTSTIDASGNATFTYSGPALDVGLHTASVTYAGDASFAPSTTDHAESDRGPESADGYGHSRGQSLRRQHPGHVQRFFELVSVGVVVGDTVTLGGTTIGSFSGKNVGTYTINATGVTMSGGPSANYTLTQPAVTAQHHAGRTDGGDRR